jgi:hypothetical protein
MNCTAEPMDLMSRVQGFMAFKVKQLSEELAEKYGVPEEEVCDIVSGFLKDTYGPAVKTAESISRKKHPVMLFIGREGCAICKRSKPELDLFLQDHNDIEPVLLDYSRPEGLLYHMIQQGESGLLPLIAMIFQGDIRMVFTGECVHPEVYERYYEGLRSQCSQNIYAL